MEITAITYVKDKDFNFTEVSEEISAKANDGYELIKTFEDDNIYVMYFREMK